MPKDSTVLAWGIYVSPVKLMAHLEAFKRVEPQLRTLRLCSRFGRGKECHVTKLPTELVQAIEDCLMEDARAQRLKKWNIISECGEGVCRVANHLSTTEMLVGYNELRPLVHDTSGSDMFLPKEHVFKITKEVIEFINRDLETPATAELCTRWRSVHAQRRSKWFSGWGKSMGDDKGDSHTLQGFLRSYFGLQCCTHFFRPFEHQDLGATNGVAEPEQVALLYLAGKDLPTQGMRRTTGGYGGVLFKAAAVYLLDEVISATPSQKTLMRFKRATKMLGLKPMAKEDSRSPSLKKENSPEHEDIGPDEMEVGPSKAFPTLVENAQSEVLPDLKLFERQYCD